MYPGKHQHANLHAIFGLIFKTPKLDHAGRQIRLSAQTGSYKLIVKIFNGSFAVLAVLHTLL